MSQALVTGANKGVGLATARALGRLGIKVWLGIRSEERGLTAEARLRAEGLDVTYLPLEVTNPRSISEAVDRIATSAPSLEILVNNAGIMAETADNGRRIFAPSQVSAEMLQRVFDTNLFGAIHLIQACLPLLHRAKSARIVNVSSRLGSFALRTDPNWPHRHVNHLAYSCSKAALNMATVAFAEELRDAAIKVNAVSPGIVATDLNGVGAANLAGQPGFATPESGAELVVRCATLSDDGPSGCFFGPDGPTPW